MIFNFQQAIRALILLAFTILIFHLHFTGDITKFINPKYVGLSQSASIIFLLLFFIQITRIWTNRENHHDRCHHNHDDHNCEHHHDHGNTPFTVKKLFSYLIIISPLLSGFLLPAKILDAAIAEKKGGMAILTNQKQMADAGLNNGSSENNNKTGTEERYVDDNTEENEIDENLLIHENADPNDLEQNTITKDEYEQLTQELLQNSNIVMDEAMFATYYDEISMNIDKYKGKNIELTGFVYKEAGLKQEQLVISRYLISHCVADASIIGFLTELPEASSIKEDTWIKAKGILDVTTYNGTVLPYIKITNWEKVSEPKEPYLYPLNIKVL
ncbi:TIGR03943 family putative permease subunit [Metabacillus sediminilitoris]|uniref:TIGR03943 family protein n=1 Tax=Metabacillus sediminilitoris TaxID=2567941 RepID=A0A4S4BW55_9BACI|nr:TIGR03943 family protein [Metabacillus sediminilitoris]QGQ46336.1 TIGR03943 family protein [Metabacillus sediminilitoris]THF79385.1 TIGR03943 family protein [Metabacillus sediminilitoris]